ncbi:zinc finger protein [Macleaya cordata]|uniref:Zinc finger protein n=1 Tax=Macleaya cordata TaxID=56857 RepID=A0A200PLY4_MACCD|nr:zinc finger protein [Macleaya cordata]
MLIQSSVPSSIEEALSFVSDHGKQDLLCDWISSGKTWQKCPTCPEHHWDSARERRGNDSLLHSRNCSKLSTVSAMCASSAPNLVYKRRKLQRNSVTLLSSGAAYSIKGSGDCLSNNCSEMPSLSAEKDCNLHSQIDNDNYSVRGAPIMTASLCNKDLLGIGNSSISEQVYPQNFDDVPCSKIRKTKGLEVLSKSVSNNGCSGGEVEGCDEARHNSIQKSAFAYYNVNDSCSSSKSNIELGSASIKSDMDDTGECSSSDILTTDLSGGSLTEKELCISILRKHGLLQPVSPDRNCTSNDVVGISADRCNFQSCKICGHLENPQKMLICDHCEEAFHVSCCNPRIRKIPVDEWFCQPCSRKKRKISAETTSGKSINAKSEVSKYRIGTFKDELDPILFMLNDTEPYTTGVRIGKGFQADVPDWSGPIANDVECIGEPLEMDPTDCDSLCGLNAKKSSAPSSIGNWLQCREVLDDGTEEGTICGKWRRAPLFEVQTDDWDCSCAVVWDPVHSDCAVPQELGTDQVLKHLKYIEMLRPRLVAKKRKLSRSKSDTDDIRSVTSKHGGDP